MSGRRVIAAVVLAVSAISLGALPAVAATPSLSAAVAISGDRVGYARVHLDHPIRVDSDKGEPRYTAAFTGPGEYQAIILRSESVSRDGDAYSLLVQRDSPGGGAGTGADATLDPAHSLPAGDYRVYLVFDKGPASARLRFADGPELSVTPDAPVNARAGPLPTRGSSKSNVEIFGASNTLDSFGYVFFRFRFSFVLAMGSLEDCFYPEGDADAGPDAYGRGCPGGVSDGVHDGLLPGATGGGDFIGDTGPPAFGYGVNATYTGLAPQIDTLGVWISYGDQIGAPRAAPWLALARDVLTVRHGKVQVPVACRARTRCRGRLRVAPGGRATRVQVPARATRVFHVRLPRPLARAVASHGRTRATLRLSGAVSGVRRSESRRVTLRQG